MFDEMVNHHQNGRNFWFPLQRIFITPPKPLVNGRMGKSKALGLMFYKSI